MNNSTIVTPNGTSRRGLGIPEILGIVFAIVSLLICLALYIIKEIMDAGGVASFINDMRDIAKGPFHNELTNTDLEYTPLDNNIGHESASPPLPNMDIPVDIDDDPFLEPQFTDHNDLKQVVQSAVMAEKRRSRAISMLIQDDNNRPMSGYTPYNLNPQPLPSYNQLMHEEETPF